MDDARITPEQLKEINEWVEKIMLSEEPNWPILPGLRDWLSSQSLDARILFHSKRIDTTLTHETPVNKLRNLGSLRKVAKLKTKELLIKRTCKAKRQLTLDPELYRLAKLWVSMGKTNQVELTANLADRAERRLAGTGVTLEHLRPLLERH